MPAPEPAKADDGPLCNLCGETCILSDGGWHEPNGLIRAAVRGGYLSTAGNGVGALDDCTSYHFSICEFCLDWLFEQFLIPVRVEDYLDGVSPPPWRPARERVQKDDWRTLKKQYFNEAQRRAEKRRLRGSGVSNSSG